MLPSIATLSRSTFPATLTSFIGRDEDVASLVDASCTHHLVTLVGAGGVGKTRLAITVAQKVAARYPAGAWFVDLAAVNDASQVATVIANTLQLLPNADITVLLEYLESREILLVLDNCEHLIDTIADVTSLMLQKASQITILATSREVLRIAGEWVWRVPALPTPPMDAIDPLSYAAVRLFVERAAANTPRVNRLPQELQIIASICTRLDGIPLAIELAAARAAVLSVTTIAQRLDDVFSLLVAHHRSVLSRHQTLRATIAWSYAMLAPAEQLLFRRLSVCTGSWTLDAAEALGGVPPLDVTAILELLTSLYDKSLLDVERDGPEHRYRFLETIRQFGLEQLASLSELAACRQRHLEYYVGFVQHAAAQVIGPEQAECLLRIEAEMPNIWNAYTWGREREDPNTMIILATDLGEYWYRHGKYAEGRAWLEDVLNWDGIADHPLYAVALFVHGNLTSSQEAYQVSTRSLQRSREICAACGDTWGQARAISVLGWNALGMNDVPLAGALFDEALALLETGSRGIVYYEALGRFGCVCMYRQDYHRARTLFETAIAGCRALGDVYNLARRLIFLGEMLRLIGEIDQSEQCYLESFTLFSVLGNRHAYAMSLDNLARIAMRRGDLPTAHRRQCDALALFVQHQGPPSNIYTSTITAGIILVCAGDLSVAAQLYGAAAAYAEKHGVRLSFTGQPEYDSSLTQLKARLDVPAFTAAWNAGQSEDFADVVQRCLSTKQTIAALHLSGDTLQVESNGKDAHHLTAREKEVLRLLALGLTNRQIADQLVVSTKTVGAHLTAIFKKLHVTTRSAATRYAIEQHLA